jgi:RNA polymerase sigma-70 factor (ECF subfamily)
LTLSSSKLDPDPALVRKAQEGDRGALRALLEMVGPSVKQWALAHTGDPDAAADLSQEVFLLVLKKISSYRGDARFLSWLFTVTRNQALEEIRRRRRQERKMNRFKVHEGAPTRTANPGGDRVDRDRVRTVLDAFVRELPSRQREVFQLADLQGLTSPEIGEILHLKPVSVRAALLKARRFLRRRILESHPELVEEFLS